MDAKIPFYPYRFFFCYVEPIVTVIAALLAGIPALYLYQLKYALNEASAPLDSSYTTYDVPVEVAVSSYQLANLYLGAAVLGRVLLTKDTNIKAWKAYIASFLIADICHVMTMFPLAEDGLLGAFRTADKWSIAGLGMIGYLAVAIVIRVAFLLEIGVESEVSKSTTVDPTPIGYKVLFLYFNPFASAIATVLAALPSTYLSVLSSIKIRFSQDDSFNFTQATVLADEVTVALYQLANMSLMFTLMEHFILKHSRTRKTWRTVHSVFVMIDAGLFASLTPIGPGVVWRVTDWNSVAWIGIGTLWFCAVVRMAYLLEIGFDKTGEAGTEGPELGSRMRSGMDDGKSLTSSFGRKKDD